MNKVIVTANPQNGQVFTKSENLGKDGKQYGFIRVESTSLDMSGAVARVKTLSALKTISEDDYNKIANHLKAGTELPGRIRVVETTDVERAKKEGFKPKMAGSGENAQPCLLDGAQIYRKTEYDSTGSLADEIIRHNNEIVGTSVKAGASSLNG